MNGHWVVRQATPLGGQTSNPESSIWEGFLEEVTSTHRRMK